MSAREPYLLSLSRQARKFLATLREPTRSRIDRALAEMASDPRGAGCKQLQGSAGTWRRRVGDWRIVYLIDDLKHELAVQIIDDRKQVYR